MKSHSGGAERIADELGDVLAQRKRAVLESLRRKMLSDRSRAAALVHAEQIARGRYKAHAPPTRWTFVDPLKAKIKGGKGSERTWTEEQTSDYRSFNNWHSMVTQDICAMVEFVSYFVVQRDECDGEPRAKLAPQLHAKVAAALGSVKDAYRRMDEEGRIEWMPTHFYSHGIRDPRRRSITAIEYLQAALLAFDDAGDRLL